ncbi:proteophosphoglycan ppg4 [Gracilaria domingensis]|nr:proteophosphoglycan ppg4 [Gracilaria domingensis]
MLRSATPSALDSDSPGPLPPALLKKLDSLTPWHEQVEALQQLADLTIPLSKTANSEAIMRQLRPYSHDLAEVINNPRSTLVKEACLCLETLAETFGPLFVEAVGTEVIPALLKRCAITKAVIRDSSREAAKAMFEHGVEGVNIGTARFISQTVLDKQSPVLIRAAAAEFIGMILVERCRGSISEIRQLISNGILGGCCDSDETVRAISRDNCCRLLELEPALGREVFDSLPANAQQYIARFHGIPKAMEEPVRPRRASMMPQRARPRPEPFGGNVPSSLKGRYAPSRVHRASVNPAEFGSSVMFSDSMAARASMLPRPSRVEFETRANLPRKHSRPNLRPPRRSMAPKTAPVDMESIAGNEEHVSKSPPSTNVVAPSHRLIKPSASTEFTPPAQRARSATLEESARKQSVEQTCTISPATTNAPDGAEDQGENTGECKRDGKHGTAAVSVAANTSSTGGWTRSDEGAKDQSEASDAADVNGDASATVSAPELLSPTETKALSSHLCSPIASCSEVSKSTTGSRSAASWKDSAGGGESNSGVARASMESSGSVETAVQRVNKGRLSFIMGVNQTPQVIRTRRLVRADMSASALLMTSPGSVQRAAPADDANEWERMDIDTRAATSEASGEDDECDSRWRARRARKSDENSGEAERTVGDAAHAGTQDDSECAAAHGEAVHRESDVARTGERRESRDIEETVAGGGEELLKTPQLCMPDASDFAELMADIEKQARRSVAPQLAVRFGGSGDKENGARKDSADVKPPAAPKSRRGGAEAGGAEADRGRGRERERARRGGREEGADEEGHGAQGLGESGQQQRRTRAQPATRGVGADDDDDDGDDGDDGDNDDGGGEAQEGGGAGARGRGGGGGAARGEGGADAGVGGEDGGADGAARAHARAERRAAAGAAGGGERGGELRAAAGRAQPRGAGGAGGAVLRAAVLRGRGGRARAAARAGAPPGRAAPRAGRVARGARRPPAGGRARAGRVRRAVRAGGAGGAAAGRAGRRRRRRRRAAGAGRARGGGGVRRAGARVRARGARRRRLRVARRHVGRAAAHGRAAGARPARARARRGARRRGGRAPVPAAARVRPRLPPRRRGARRARVSAAAALIGRARNARARAPRAPLRSAAPRRAALPASRFLLPAHVVDT